MGFFFVRQPNGLLAVFCPREVNFTSCDLREPQAVRWARAKGLSASGAKVEVKAGLRDEQIADCRLHLSDKGGRRRWTYCLGLILEQHGWTECLKIMHELGDPEAQSAWNAI